MDDNNSNQKNDNAPKSKKSWLDKLMNAITGEPQTKEELIEVLRDGAMRHIVDYNSLNMLEGVLEVHELRVRDVMVPRSQMTTLKYDMQLEEILKLVVGSGHSRFPVIGENNDEIFGVLLAKDLLSYAFSDTIFNIKDIIRNPEFIPESKRLDTLLQDFRIKRNHIAIVVDEYGGVTGLITIEDVIEQIVGDISDEHDIVESPVITKRIDNTYTIKALATLEEFNEYFDTNFDDKEVETIGGFILKKFGHMPDKGETIEIDNFIFKILRADKRRIFLLHAINKQQTDEKIE